MKPSLLIILLFYCHAIYSQFDSIYWKSITLKEDDNMHGLSIMKNQVCESKNIYVSNANVLYCDSIKDKNIIPTKYHREYLKERLIELNQKEDTLEIKFLLHFQCCAEFLMELECVDSSRLNINIKDVSPEYCWCGNCPYLFACNIVGKHNEFRELLINGDSINFSKEIYKNLTINSNKNFFTGIKTVKYYYNDILPRILMERIYSRKGDLISTKYYYIGKEIIE